MEDHHVDRPDVKARQRVELTGTNSSFGLIALIYNAHSIEWRIDGNRPALLRSVLRRPGGISWGPEPDPIPNSAVKLPCADGTKSQGLEE